MKQLDRRKKIIIFRNTDNKKMIVDTIEEAMQITGCNENYIRHSATRPTHYSNRADYWEPVTINGKIRTRTIKPLYRFEYVEPVLLIARPMFENEIREYEFKSYYTAIKTIECSESTFYSHRKSRTKFIVDKYKRLWNIEWRFEDES